MSVAWADAQVMPFASAQVRARAKAVLKSYAKYVDVTGRSWVTMSVLLVETDLGCVRTVRRGIADLKAAGFLEETGDSRVHFGRVYPIYLLPLDRGPKNTRDRLRGVIEDLDDEGQGAAVGVTPVSPQEADPEACCDTGVTPRDDAGVRLGVTPVSPKEKDNPPHYVRREDKSTPGAREAAARLGELEGLAPAAMLRFYDQPTALAAMQVLLGEAGFDADQLKPAMLRMRGHPEFRSRKHPPQLHDWLKKRAFMGWLADDEPEGDLFAASAAPAADDPRLEQLRAAVRPFVTEGEFASYVAPATLGETTSTVWIVARTDMGRSFIDKACWGRIANRWREVGDGRAIRLTTKSQFEALDRLAEG